MKPVLAVAAAMLQSAAAASEGGVTLYGLQLNDGETLDMTPLRGSTPGDIWQPNLPGTNIMRCGALGNTKYLGKRTDIEVSQEFDVSGRVYSFDGDGLLSFSIKYGQNPNFNFPGYTFKNVKVSPTELPYEWTEKLSIPMPAYSYNATIQVEYTTYPKGDISEDATDNEGSVAQIAEAQGVRKYYQCIDIAVTGAASFPEGFYPHGFIPPELQPEVETDELEGTEILLPPQPEGLAGGWIALIAIAALIVVGIILYFLLCKQPKTVEFQNDPFEAPAVKVARAPVDVEAPAPVPPVEEKIEEKIEEKEVEVEVEEDEEEEVQPAQVTGSMGRHFHFRYVEKEDEDEE